jgi:hypothetical protein
MRALSAWELLDLWERGLAQPSLQRALTLLAAANPGTPLDALAALSIGQRDAQLLTLREWAFGAELMGLATCPECGERLELAFNVEDIRVETPSQPSPYEGEDLNRLFPHQGEHVNPPSRYDGEDLNRPPPDRGEGARQPSPHRREGAIEPSPYKGEGREGVETLSLVHNGYQVRFRLPNSLDLVAIAGNGDVDATRQGLLERCLLTVHHDGAETAVDRLPAEVLDAVVGCMAEADPQADVQLDLTCPECEHRWQAAFDIVTYFWTEINAWAHRILREVHTLASAYGWREADILAMSAWRRAYYLELVGGA